MPDYIPNPYDTYEPEESSFIDVDETTEVEIKINAEINVDADGYYDYTDTEYSWAKDPSTSSGDWYSDEYNVYLGNATDMVEYIDEMLSDVSNFPEVSGKYKVTGVATLVFNITGVEEDRSYFDNGNDYDSEIYTDDAEVNYDKKSSSITDIKFTRI